MCDWNPLLPMMFVRLIYFVSSSSRFVRDTKCLLYDVPHIIHSMCCTFEFFLGFWPIWIEQLQIVFYIFCSSSVRYVPKMHMFSISRNCQIFFLNVCALLHYQQYYKSSSSSPANPCCGQCLSVSHSSGYVVVSPCAFN